jgi:hypothetical protein
MRGTTSAGPRRETAEVSTDPPIGIAGASLSLHFILCDDHHSSIIKIIPDICLSGRYSMRL